jgi:hypothetical protein
VKVWLSKTILGWPAYGTGGPVLQPEVRQRSYEHLARAEYFLKNMSTATSADRADCISNLRKCLTHRLQLLEKVYGLRRIAERGKRRPYLQILAEFSLVRPVLLERLLKVRNAIEYRDVQPPSTGRCREFVDLLWYFLRSTDSILSTQRTDIQLSPTPDQVDAPYGCSVDLKYRPRLKIEMSAWLPSDLVFHSAIAEALPFAGEVVQRAQKRPLRRLDKDPTDIWINGRVVADKAGHVEIITLALNCID